ncbi:CBASS cGAMP-activated phospholipase [Flavobacterium sp. ST-75]|uniref:CBASS cGAMP-activated phospholipase n=1 Tax=Flavobacterium rhizophilum TaxID=3163296 RepID=A0ABW8YC48_9FLAO
MKTFKVLSIDGGGIKGLYSATILNKIEKQLIKDSGDNSLRIVDYFDLICGTSTGGLIALALSLGISTEEICKFYTQHGPKIFRWSKGKIPLIRQALLYGKYSDKKLKKALYEVLKNNKIKNSKCLLCIPTFDITHGTYEIFKYDHPEGNLSRDNELLMVDVALATSAAPTYFPIAEMKQHDNKLYADGGLWANNPSLIGYTEALRYFVGENKAYDNIQLLSISSLNSKQTFLPFSRRKRSFIGWRQQLFDSCLTGQSEFCNIFLESLSQTTSNLDYYRIKGDIKNPIHSKSIQIDFSDKTSLSLLSQYGNDMYHSVKKDIVPYFINKKTYITNNEF